jgi:hypothetical protein
LVVPVAVHYTAQAAEVVAHGQTVSLEAVVGHGVVMSLAAEVPLLRLMPEGLVATMPLDAVTEAAVGLNIVPEAMEDSQAEVEVGLAGIVVGRSRAGTVVLES